MKKAKPSHSRTIRRRTHLFWMSVRNSPKPFWTFYHNIVGPQKGCSCTFCFYSKRRSFPPGHPGHETQLEARIAELERRQPWRSQS